MGSFRGSIGAFALKFASAFLKDDRGQATTEYILIVSFSITFTVALAKVILNTLDNGILRLGGQLEQDLKTGSAPLLVWQN